MTLASNNPSQKLGSCADWKGGERDISVGRRHDRPSQAFGYRLGGEVQGYSRETDCWVPAQDEGARRFEYLQSQPLFALVLVCRSGTTRDLICLANAQLGSESGDGVSMLLQRESGIAWYRCGRFEASKHQSHHGPPSALINLGYVAT